MTPAGLAAYIHEQMLARADAEFATGQRRFFQHEVDTYGVRTAELNALIRDVARIVKPWPVTQRNTLMKLLWETGKIESGALVCSLSPLRQTARNASSISLKVADRYVATGRTVMVWPWLLVAASPTSPNCAISLSPGRRLEPLGVAPPPSRSSGRLARPAYRLHFDIAARLLSDRDDMVEKVWAGFEESYLARPAETLAFLMAQRATAQRLTLRYAAEKMPPPRVRCF